MPELNAKDIATLAPILTEVLTLAPPPTPKGRYALVRWGMATEAPAESFTKKHSALMASVAVDGSIAEAGPGRVTFTVQADQREFYASESAAIDDEIIALGGVRQITHAELGACPITGAQEKVLIQCGVLEDAEPA